MFPRLFSIEGPFATTPFIKITYPILKIKFHLMIFNEFLLFFNKELDKNKPQLLHWDLL